jgi:tight adherence protein B
MWSLNERRKRLKAVVGRVASVSLNAAGANDAERRKAIQAKLREVEGKRSGQRKYRLVDAIAQAGLDLTIAQFAAASLISAIALGVIGYQAGPVVALLGVITGGFGVPQFYLRWRTKRRLAGFIALFAEALDVIIRGVRSGLPLGECLHVVSRDVADPVGAEFRMVTEGIRLGMTLEQTLRRMSERVPTPEVRFFAIVIGIQQQTGGNLAETLHKLTEVLRARKRMRDKVGAASSEAKTSAMIIGSLPVIITLVLGIVSPDYISLLFTTSPGNWILAGGALTMSLGIFVMRSMINFDI